MSEFNRQEAFGPRTYIDVSASGSLSGRDTYDTLDTTHLFPDHDYPASSHPLQTPLDGYAQSQYAFSSHSSGVSLPGLQYTLPSMATHPIPQHYEHDPSIMDELNGFSPIAPNFSVNVNAYRTPYPDSNATSTSSATSPDPNSVSLMNEPIIYEAEEDKRKRNQAASARFRQKKKQREQQLVESTREMQDRAKRLEAENDGLRKENVFLKKLLVEKVDHMSEEDRRILKKATSEALEGEQ